MSSRAPICHESDVKEQGPSTEEVGEQNGARSGQTWHHMLLHPSPSSSQLSYISEMHTEAGSQPSTPLQTRLGLFGELDESATNCDSGNFSLSESGGKEKLMPAGSSGDLHQCFVQLNTELYQTKTELLAYKYKWNEIRNEIELSWSTKIDKLLDEKNDIQKELEAVSKEIAHLKSQPQNPIGFELLRVRSELDDVMVQLHCKEKANENLAQKIVEQHVEKENLVLQKNTLEHKLLEGRSELCRLTASERWFRDELHRCQNENAKLKESYASLDNQLRKERLERDALVEAARGDKLRLIGENQTLLSRVEEVTNQLAKELRESSPGKESQEGSSPELSSSGYVEELLENNRFLEEQNAELQAGLRQLHDTFKLQQQQIEALTRKEGETLKDIVRLQEHREADRTQIATLTAQLARECFTKRQIDVTVEKLKAQLKVLSIYSVTRNSPPTEVEECESVRHGNQDLLEQPGRVIGEPQTTHSNRAMCTDISNQRGDDMLLIENFRSIESKNLNLEIKLGQCGGSEKDTVVDGRSVDMVAQSEEKIRALKQDVKELEQKLTHRSNGKTKEVNRLKPHRGFKCQKHGSRCQRKTSDSTSTSENEDGELRELRILLKAVENDNQRRLQRYELNNRTLLKKVKEYSRGRKQAEQRAEEIAQDHAKCEKLRCEMASARERALLLEADLEASQREASSLRSEKERLIDLLQNNCLLTSDGDVWGSLKRAFHKLHELQHAQKENGYLRGELEQNAAKIQQLEASINDWKLAADVQTADADEMRSELAEKEAILQEFQCGMEQLVGENSSLQKAMSNAEDDAKNLIAKLNELNRVIRVQEIRLETAQERLKLYEESELMLAAAKESFFSDLQSLQDAILLEKQEKYELEEEVRELRQNMVNAVGNSLQNFHPTDSCSAGESGPHSTTIMSPDAQPFSLSCLDQLDVDQLRALVEESSQKRYSLQPLHECVSSLKLEMDNLNSVLHVGEYAQQQQQPNHRHQQQQRFPLSLMDELNDATNGHYGSR